MSHSKGPPDTDDKRFYPGGPTSPKAVLEMRRYWQDMGHRNVDSPILEYTHEWDALEAKKAKKKKDAWNAKQDAFTKDAEKAKAKYNLKKRRLLRDRHGVLSKKSKE